MNANIENYRGFEIWFDTELESFQCDIDDSRSVKKSYPALKKFIDDYVKENNSFKVIRVEPNPVKNRYTSAKVVKIVGVRKDGRFIGELANGEKVQVSDYDLEAYILKDERNEPFIKALAELEEEYKQAQLNRNAKEKQIIQHLQITTLEEYKNSLKGN